eukprot:445360_1
MTTRSERMANRNRMKEEEEAMLDTGVDTAPNDEFRQQQIQDADVEAANIQRLIRTRLLNENQINGNDIKIFHGWMGDNCDISVLVNEMKKTNTQHYIQPLINKYSNKNTLTLFGHLSLKTIYYILKPKSDQEAANIINSIRDAYKSIWKNCIDRQIRIKGYKVAEIRSILKKK